MLYQRTYTDFTMRMDDDMAVMHTTGSSGHFEAIVKRVVSAAGVVGYTGLFRPGGDTAAEYEHVLGVATRLMAVVNSEAASLRMAVDYDAKSKVRTFELLDAVRVRVPDRNARKGGTPNCVPGVVVGIYKQLNGSGNKQVVHQLYTVWCEHGVLTQKVKIDRLVAMSINNFPTLLAFRDETLTAQERLQSSNALWQSPLTGTLEEWPTVTIEAAWLAQQASYVQRTVDQCRQRRVAARMAANAADTAIAATQADSRTALSFATVTNQPASQPSSREGADPSRITRIIRANKTQYIVQWSKPEGNPEHSDQEVAGHTSRLHRRGQRVQRERGESGGGGGRGGRGIRCGRS